MYIMQRYSSCVEYDIVKRLKQNGEKKLQIKYIMYVMNIYSRVDEKSVIVML